MESWVKNTSVFGTVILIVMSICEATPLEKYDFIIAGGGTSGLALARRLAEGGNGKYTVLVLESGKWPREGMDISVFAPRYWNEADLTFRYTSKPQQHVGLMHDKGILPIISARVLGGGSSMNFMWYNRGHPKDYDNWGNLTHDGSWNYGNMLKYFKRVETYSGNFPSDQHGYKGPISVSRSKYAPGLKEWLAAGKYLGYSTADPNGPQRVSFTPVEFTKRHGRRDSALSGYIQPVLRSSLNLRIIVNTNVTKIIFQGNRAIGVQFESTSPLLSQLHDNCLYVNKEVIVSAGVYGSPLLLMRSGIGPRKVLTTAKIPLVQDLPVGRNYQDHVYVPLHVIVNNKKAVVDHNRDLTPESWNFLNKFGDGPFSITAGATGQGFVVSSVAKSEGEWEWPDIQLTMSHSVHTTTYTSLRHNSSLAPWEKPMVMLALVTRPKSRGSIRLNTKNTKDLPVLNVGYLTDRRDVEKMFDGIKVLLSICENSPSYRKLGARLPQADIAACAHFPYRSNEYWKCYIRHTSTPGYHGGGTCKMGLSATDPEAVVDTRLRVLGVTNLRVVDASVMPTVTNANPQAAIYAIAERAAEMILNDFKK